MSQPFLDRLGDELRAAAWREIAGEPRARRAVPLRPMAALAVIAAIGFVGARALPRADDTAVNPVPTHSAFPPALTEHFSALRRASTSGDVVPADVPRPVQGSPRAYAGALRLEDDVWVVPSGRQVCLIAGHDGAALMGCSTPAIAAGGGLFVAEIRPHATRVSGLLPDGAHDIWLTRSHGDRVSIGLSQGNFYAVSVPGNPRYLRFTGASGERRTVRILPQIERADRPSSPVPAATPTPRAG